MKTGVWLDKNKAIVVTIYDGQVSLSTILSGIEHFHPSGGFGLGYRGSPQDALPEDKYMKREIHQLKTYFKNIISEIKDADAIVLFGPAETYDKLHNEIIQNHPYLVPKVKGVVKADSMTNAQVKAWVKAFFKIGRL